MRVWILAAMLMSVAACERPNLEMTGGGYGSRATTEHPASAPDTAVPDTTAADH